MSSVKSLQAFMKHIGYAVEQALTHIPESNQVDWVDGAFHHSVRRLPNGRITIEVRNRSYRASGVLHGQGIDLMISRATGIAFTPAQKEYLRDIEMEEQEFGVFTGSMGGMATKMRRR